MRNAHDEDEETRLEALVGVARRAPDVAKKLIWRELESGRVSQLVMEAICAAPDAAFLPHLKRARELGLVGMERLIEDAIERCNEHQ